MLVRIVFRSLPRRCTPNQLRLTLDVNDDGQPGVSRLYRFRGERQRVRLTVPRHLRDPDVVAASAVTREGLSSESVKVLIAER